MVERRKETSLQVVRRCWAYCINKVLHGIASMNDQEQPPSCISGLSSELG